jgi:hypothetical protein
MKMGTPPFEFEGFPSTHFGGEGLRVKRILFWLYINFFTVPLPPCSWVIF